MNKYFLLLLVYCCINISAQAQDLYDINSVKDIKITFEEEHWDDILDSLKITKERLVGKVEIAGMRYDSVGIRYKGNSSYFNVRKHGSNKLPFNIKVNYIKKDQAFKGGYTSLKLSNVFRDPSFIREALSYEIARKYMPAPKACYVRVYVNNELLGLYNSVESVDENFIKTHFGASESEGFLIKCDPEEIGHANIGLNRNKGCSAGDYASLMYVGKDSICYQKLYEMKSGYGWQALIDLAKNLKEKPEKISKQINVDQVLWMHAYNNVLVNLDSYSGRLSHNYYLYSDTSGIFHPVIWDLNLSFGGFRYHGDALGLSNEEMQTMSPFLHYKTVKRPLISQLLKQPLYRKIYLAHLKTILEENFTNGEYLRRATQLQQQIDYYVNSDKNKLYEYDKFKENLNNTTLAGKTKIIGIKELMDARSKYLANHALMKKEQPEISNAMHSQSGDEYIFTAKVQGAEKVFLAYRPGAHGVFKRRLMLDTGEKGDQNEGDQIYTVVLPKSRVKDYYIIAEAAKTAQLSPKRASFEFYKTK